MFADYPNYNSQFPLFWFKYSIIHNILDNGHHGRIRI